MTIPFSAATNTVTSSTETTITMTPNTTCNIYLHHFDKVIYRKCLYSISINFPTGFSDIRVPKEDDTNQKQQSQAQLQQQQLQQQQLHQQIHIENLQQHQIVISQEGSQVLQTIQPLQATPHMLGDQPTIGIGGQLLSFTQPVTSEYFRLR